MCHEDAEGQRDGPWVESMRRVTAGGRSSAEASATDADIAVYQAQRAHELELNRATAAFEHAALAPLYLLNGGAALAYLTLLGAASAGDSDLTVLIWAGAVASTLWSAGLVTAAFATRTAYISQQKFARSTNLRRRIMEARLVEGGRLAGALSRAANPSPGQSAPPDAGIEELQREAKAHQQRWLLLSALSLAFFVLGALFGSLSLLLAQG